MRRSSGCGVKTDDVNEVGVELKGGERTKRLRDATRRTVTSKSELRDRTGQEEPICERRCRIQRYLRRIAICIDARDRAWTQQPQSAVT
jgi:uncharacterized Fe-S radical SAM superfamily protein PflX